MFTRLKAAGTSLVGILLFLIRFPIKTYGNDKLCKASYYFVLFQSQENFEPGSLAVFFI